MKIFKRYFERNPICCSVDFSNQPKAIVIIPVLDDKDIFETIDSLKACSCQEGRVGVIVVVNHGEDASPLVKQANEELAKELKVRYCEGQMEIENVNVKVIEAFDISPKWAGVGMARKLAMDAAAFFFYKQNMPECPILSLDADTLVEENYLDVVIRYFRENAVAGVSIAYAHRYESCPEEMADAIIKYELYLRYYQLALAYVGHPHAYHCIGSAFAVRAVDYVAQGGMNKRQAGEDFYFLQKLIATGRYATLDSTCVYPSARFSTRTPFGTGQTVRQIVEECGVYRVYHFAAFRDLKCFFEGLSTLYQASQKVCESYFAAQTDELQAFLADINGLDLVRDANANSASQLQFVKRFFIHFNAFRVLKYLNFVHERSYQKVDIKVAVQDLFKALELPDQKDNQACLACLRHVSSSSYKG